jgi:hypothetical protein
MGAQPTDHVPYRRPATSGCVAGKPSVASSVSDPGWLTVMSVGASA